MDLEIEQINNQEVMIYEDGENKFKVEVEVDNETVWLTQRQMSELFGKSLKTVNEHLKNIYREGELDEISTIRKSRIVQIEGDRKVERDLIFYNLDVIISVGYRVKSKQGTQFRIWATQILKDHLIKGYTLNEKRLKEKLAQFEELQNTIKILERTVQSQQIQLDEAQGLLKVISEYSYALDLLDSYDHQNVKISRTTDGESYILSYEEAMLVIEKMKNEFATDLFGREKDESFKGSLGAIYQTAFEQDLYPSIEEKASNLLYFIVKNHSFLDGNKRIAAAIFLYFMNANGILYKKDGSKKIGDNTLVAMTLMIAESKPSEKDLIVKVLVNLINDRNEL